VGVNPLSDPHYGLLIIALSAADRCSFKPLGTCGKFDECNVPFEGFTISSNTKGCIWRETILNLCYSITALKVTDLVYLSNVNTYIDVVLLKWHLHDITHKQIAFKAVSFEVLLSLGFTVDFTIYRMARLAAERGSDHIGSPD
jgi:hypothetical protein